jgi:hypothetical protein
MKISDLLLTDDIGLNLSSLILSQHALQFLLYILHLLFVACGLENG